MGTIADKLAYLSGTKVAIRDAIESVGGTVSIGTPFRDYATLIENNLSYNAAPTNPTNTVNFPGSLNKNTSYNFTFSGASDSDGAIAYYIVDNITSSNLTVSVSEVSAGSAHTFNVSNITVDESVSFRVRAKDAQGALSSGVVISLDLISYIPFTASGGTITTDATYTYHTFTSSSTFNVTQGMGDETVEYLIVAGGGSAGCCGTSGGGGGGGGGGFLEGSFTNFQAGSYSINVGAGGGNYANGGNSSFNGVTANGGGRGATSGGGSGSTGGSGGGGNPINGSGGAGISGQGYRGGNVGALNQGDNGCAGGGGAGGKASDANWTNTGSSGGPGKTSTINGVTYGAGGRGGNGTYWKKYGVAGGPNTGNGGEGSSAGRAGAAGGSGIVVLRYITPAT
jgi:hypothetical protein